MPVTTAPPAQRIVGNYQLLHPLGEGGMARVYLARHQVSGAQVVVKLMREEQASDTAFRRLFQGEVRAMMAFRHPGAVAMLDAASESDEHPFIVLEYVHGISLETLISENGPLPVNRVGALLGGLCVVLDAAHYQNLLHRDLSCANLMILGAGTPRESVKVMDFGLSRLGGFYISLASLKGDGAGIGGGTPDYVCPEQVRGDEVDTRGDIYSVGVILYRALTGHLPFESEHDVDAILLAHRDREPPAFADFRVTHVPPAVEAVVQRCLAKYPAERSASARDLAMQFGKALGTVIVAPEAFEAAAVQPTPAETKCSVAPEAVIDRFSAWMPEQVAVMKLRGFVQDVGGEVLDSQPGLIRVQLVSSNTVAAAPRGFWSWLSSAPPPPTPHVEVIELHLRKQATAGRSLVDILVVRVSPSNEMRAQRDAGVEECRRVCKELRAYLMIGR